MNAQAVQILTFDGCPNSAGARRLVERVLAESGASAAIEAITVRDVDDAARLRFLGSPTIRVDGRDIEPGADRRRDFAFACRIYTTGAGVQGLPDERWLAHALRLDS